MSKKLKVSERVGNEDTIDITPDMDLGAYSPFEYYEMQKQIYI